MVSKYFAILVLFTCCSTQAMVIQNCSKEIKNLATSVTFQHETKSIFKWIRDDIDNAFGYTHYYTYKTDNDEKQQFTKVGTIKTLKEHQLENMAKGGCYYGDSLKQKTINNDTIEIGVIIQATNNSSKPTDDTYRRLQRLYLIDKLCGNPDKKIQQSQAVKMAKQRKELEDDFVMFTAPLVMLSSKYLSPEDEIVSQLPPIFKTESEAMLKEDCETLMRQEWKNANKSSRQKFTKNRDDSFSQIKALGAQSSTTNISKDPIEDEFVTDIVPLMMLFNKKGFSKKDCEIIAHKQWDNNKILQEIYTAIIASKNLPDSTASAISINLPCTTATTSTCSTTTTAGIVDYNDNAMAKEEKIIEQAVEEILLAGKDPIEEGFITDITPLIKLLNKKGFSKEDHEIIAHKHWNSNESLQELYAAAIASKNLPDSTASAILINLPCTTATTSTCSTTTTAGIVDYNDNAMAKEEENIEQAIEEIIEKDLNNTFLQDNLEDETKISTNIITSPKNKNRTGKKPKTFITI